jgi:hypothetical protein
MCCLSMPNRDDFSEPDKRILGDQVGWRCSNPECRAPTKGPHSDDDRAVLVGVAAHICAAASGGPRYDLTQTPEQRSSIENGIHLCQTCGTRVDRDTVKYTAEVLRGWKATAKSAADRELGRPTAAVGAPVETDVDRLAALPSGAVVRLVYTPQGSGDYVHDKFQIEVLGVDRVANVLRFKSLSGNPGPPDTMPLGDVEAVWAHGDGTTFVRISGYMGFTALQPHRYVSRPRGTR